MSIPLAESDLRKGSLMTAPQERFRWEVMDGLENSQPTRLPGNPEFFSQATAGADDPHGK